MLIIWGIRVFFRTTGQGLFHCPRCGGDRRYRRRAGRRFLTLFFIPVIPLTRAGEHVQCTTCRARYHVGALRAPTAAQMQAALPAGMRAAAATMLRAGDQDCFPARHRAIQAIAGAGAQGYGDAALDADLAEPDGAWRPPWPRWAPSSPSRPGNGSSPRWSGSGWPTARSPVPNVRPRTRSARAWA